MKNKNTLLLNTLFGLCAAAILIFLYLAPEETTPFLPHDQNHNPFYKIKSKKEAEKSCLSCHDIEKESPLPEDHPAKYRCLFCHKRE